MSSLRGTCHYSYNLVDGSFRWSKTYTSFLFYQPTPLGNNLIVTCNVNVAHPQALFTSINLDTGETNWSNILGKTAVGPMVVNGNIGLLDIGGYDLHTIDLISGNRIALKQFPNYITLPIIHDGKAYMLARPMNPPTNLLSLIVYDYNSGVASPAIKITNDLSFAYMDSIILIGDRFYFATENNNIYSVNISGTDLQSHQIAPTGRNLKYMMFTGDSMAVMGYYSDLLYLINENAFVTQAETTVQLNSPYKNDGDYIAYLGQTHSHYRKDIFVMPDKAPADVVARYRDVGYDFVAMTEHNEIVSNPDVPGILFIENSEEDTTNTHILSLAIHDPIDQGKSFQERINQIFNQNGFSSLAHPNSYSYWWDIADLKSLKNYNAIEVFNGGINAFAPKIVEGVNNLKIGRTIFTAYAFDKWDQLLSNNNFSRKWATAGDDYTPWDPDSFDKAAVIVLAKTNNQSEIIQNLKDGNFYALKGSQAPRMSIATTADTIYVTTETPQDIYFIGKNGEPRKLVAGVTNASYQANGDEGYIRVQIGGGTGQTWSQPIGVEKRIVKTASGSGLKSIDFGDGILTARTKNNLNLRNLVSAELPIVSPDGGYLSPVMSFETEGNIETPATLVMNYENLDPAIVDRLSIYTFNQLTNSWENIPSVVDKTSGTVTSTLPHFSLYTLSYAPSTDDVTAPAVSLSSEIDLMNISGEVELSATASDSESQIASVRAYLDDGQVLFNDWYGGDGYNAEIDFSRYPTGAHTMTLVAEDEAGNIGTKDYQIIIQSLVLTPKITINPIEDFYDCISLSGTFESSLEIGSIGIYMDEHYIGRAELSSKLYIFEQNLDIANIDDGEHDLEIILIDIEGNSTSAKSIIIKHDPNELNNNINSNGNNNSNASLLNENKNTSIISSNNNAGNHVDSLVAAVISPEQLIQNSEGKTSIIEINQRANMSAYGLTPSIVEGESVVTDKVDQNDVKFTEVNGQKGEVKGESKPKNNYFLLGLVIVLSAIIALSV
ncbi:MAG: hypothetical protein WCO23_04960, partial [bacterium]